LYTISQVVGQAVPRESSRRQGSHLAAKGFGESSHHSRLNVLYCVHCWIKISRLRLQI
jgi:hypothetical protein